MGTEKTKFTDHEMRAQHLTKQKAVIKDYYSSFIMKMAQDLSLCHKIADILNEDFPELFWSCPTGGHFHIRTTDEKAMDFIADKIGACEVDKQESFREGQSVYVIHPCNYVTVISDDFPTDESQLEMFEESSG